MFTGVCCTREHFDHSGMEGVQTENHDFFRKVVSRIIHYGKAGSKILIVCDQITCDCFQVKWPLLVLDKFRAQNIIQEMNKYSQYEEYVFHRGLFFKEFVEIKYLCSHQGVGRVRLNYYLSIKSTVQMPGGLIEFTFASLFMQNILNEKPGVH